MADDNNEQPIIIKRIKKSHGGHHGGAWKVAFADFMTAMMAFFMVMWLVGQSDRVKQAVAGYFRDPGKFQNMGKSGVLKGSDAAVPGEAANMGVVNLDKESNYIPTRADEDRMQLAGKDLMGELGKEKAFGDFEKNIKVQMTSEGLRIVLNESENAPAFFEPGSTKLLQKSAVILATIARELGKLSNRIVIEGHTDAGFTGDKEFTNWELSAGRANSARALMEVSGLNNGQVREVRGYADKFPMIKDNPADPRNRRITILVLYEAREKAYDELAVGQDMFGSGG